MKAKAKPDPMQADPSCGVCKFWKEQSEPKDDERWGLCRRYPPSPTLSRDPDTGEETLAEMWAPTSVEDWCGCFVGNQ